VELFRELVVLVDQVAVVVADSLDLEHQVDLELADKETLVVLVYLLAMTLLVVVAEQVLQVEMLDQLMLVMVDLEQLLQLQVLV
jgi:hypothetical protein